MVSCLMKDLTKKMKLKNIAQRLDVSNVIIKIEKMLRFKVV